jgi:hypothetical protein
MDLRRTGATSAGKGCAGDQSGFPETIITTKSNQKLMQSKLNPLAAVFRLGLLAALALGFLAQAQAEDKKADANGTYTWTMPGRNGGPDRKMTLKLKVEGDKVTGKITAPGRDGQTRDTDISEGKLTGDEVAFTVVREFNGNKMTQKFKGKVGAESIKGKIEFERDGEKQSRDWEAKREAEKK